MKILVFGSSGQLGTELMKACRERGDEVAGRSHLELDVTDAGAVAAAISDSGAELVFNAAAYTKVDQAEGEQALAARINGDAVGFMATACAARSIPLVHYSTDYVFDGAASAPVGEDAPTNPLSAYGRTKLEGEQRLLASGVAAYLVRTAWLYGHEGPNFVKTVLRVCREKGEMRIVDDQRGSPTWARDLARASRRLVEAGPPSAYHLTNSGDCTWCEFARAIVELAGVDARIDPITTAEYPTPALRPPYSVLENRRWRALGEPPLRHWREALSEFVGELAPG